MRKMIGDTKEALEFAEKIDSMSPSARAHMRMVLLKLIECYVSDDYRAVIVAGRDGAKRFDLISVNADEMVAADLLSRATGVLVDMNTEDMPEKGMLN